MVSSGGFLTFQTSFFFIHTFDITWKFICNVIVIFTESETIFSDFETIILTCFCLWFPKFHAIIISDQFWTESQVNIRGTWTALQTIDTTWAVIFATLFLSFTIGQAVSITSASKIAVVLVVGTVCKTFFDLIVPENFAIAWWLVLWWEIIFAPDNFLVWISDFSSDSGLEFSKWLVIGAIDLGPSAWTSVGTIGMAWAVVRTCDGIIVTFHCTFIVTI